MAGNNQQKISRQPLKHSYRHDNFTLEKNQFRFDWKILGDEDLQDAAPVAAEQQQQEEQEEELEEKKDDTPSGWTDSVYLPFDFDFSLPANNQKLQDIARECKIAIAYDVESGTLNLSADDKDTLYNGRGKVNELLYSKQRAIVSKTNSKARFPKADRPGTWGQPREETVRGPDYKMLGKHGPY